MSIIRAYSIRPLGPDTCSIKLLNLIKSIPSTKGSRIPLNRPNFAPVVHLILGVSGLSNFVGISLHNSVERDPGLRLPLKITLPPFEMEPVNRSAPFCADFKYPQKSLGYSIKLWSEISAALIELSKVIKSISLDGHQSFCTKLYKSFDHRFMPISTIRISLSF